MQNNLSVSDVQRNLGLSDEMMRWLGRIERPSASPAPRLPSDDEAAHLMERLGVEPADQADTLAARLDPDGHPELWWVFERIYSTVRARSYNTGMGAPYSKDLRLRVLAALDNGMSKWRAHQTFKVSRSTIDDWLKLREKTGKIEATINYHRGPAPTLSDSLELRSFIEEHKNSTLSQIAEAWFAARGQRLSTVTFSKTLKRRLGQNGTFRACPLGYTRKKRVISTKSVH